MQDSTQNLLPPQYQLTPCLADKVLAQPWLVNTLHSNAVAVLSQLPLL
jgi:hypothetical protein